jgi:uncharacterized protein with HEPN domain
MNTQIYIRLKHMLDASQAALKHLSRRKREDLDVNRTVLSAIVRELEIIGEAANSIPPTFRKKYPEIPWKQMIAMRNRLIHAYFDVDHDIVWTTTKDHLPILIQRLEMLLESISSDDENKFKKALNKVVTENDDNLRRLADK